PEAPKPSTNPNDGNTTVSNINGAANGQSGSNSSGQNAGTGLAENQSNSSLLAAGALILAVAGLIAYKKKYYTK
ncbi:MAG: LPXTG cell wall anchor domain-containing protein, partial [Eubacterium callanderi]